jgi:hypothetical protein
MGPLQPCAIAIGSVPLRLASLQYIGTTPRTLHSWPRSTRLREDGERGRRRRAREREEMAA